MANVKLMGELRQTVANQLKDIIKTCAGKGPSDLKLITFENIIKVQFCGFLTHLEKSLLKSKTGERLVVEVRKAMFELIKDDVAECFASNLDIKVQGIEQEYELYSDYFNVNIIFEREMASENEQNVS